MVWKNKKKAAEQVLPLTDKALAAVLKTLSEVGLTERFGFDQHVQDPNSYSFGNCLEWSERGFGTRFYVHLGANQRVNKILCVNLYNDYEAVPQEKLDKTNETLKTILAELNN